MDNKLSELSKPVAYDYQIAGACIADGNDKKWVDWDNEITHECPPDWMVEDGKATGIKPLYSQEYVSALLAERDAFEASALAMRDEWRARGERIAELEQTMRHIHGAALDITVPRMAIAKAAELAVEHAAMKEQSNG
ncbi:MULTISPECIES: hypothetical protein [unclassified Serratia (in: enterobacteria)]|uniref:hypothetical protein n=1 Tax=unclassified Serratia (in: enterobacteria) TaxID=2647522 RepID=UPI0015F53F05|nr:MULTISPECIES: hypothetical protein [unclassified Serratia (in: enterobacteria)]